MMQEFRQFRPNMLREQSYREAGVYLGPHPSYSLVNNLDRGIARNNGSFMEYQPDTPARHPSGAYKHGSKEASLVSRNSVHYENSSISVYSSVHNIPRESWKSKDTHNNNYCSVPKNGDLDKTLDLSLHDNSPSKNVTSSGKPFPPDLLGQTEVGDCLYACGSCRSQYEAIAGLHEHLQSHAEGGSYYYNHHTRTAFPKFDSVCKDTQTVKLQPENKRSIGTISNGLGTEQKYAHTDEFNHCKNKLRKPSVGYYSISSSSKNKGQVVTNNVADTIEVKKDIKNEDEENKDKDAHVENATLSNSDNHEDTCAGIENNSDHDSDENSVTHISRPAKIIKTRTKPTNKNNSTNKGKQTKYTLAVVHCKVCQQKFSGNQQLQRHVRKDHYKVKHICVTCSEQFESKSELEVHKKAAHNKTVQVHKCDLCSKVLSTKGMLQGHYLVHKGIKPFSCEVCQPKREFTRKCQLQAHMQTHSAVKNLQCEFCGKPFSARYLMNNHVKHCGGIKPHKCEYCEMRFVSNHSMLRHRRKHTGEKPFICEVCAFASGNASCLARHMRTHTGEKPFVCTYCQQAFAAPGALKKHVRTHTQEKPYLCGYCNKGFTQRWNLKTHERQHTGETPYTCTICGSGYKQNVLLKTHMKTHYGHVIHRNQTDSTAVAGTTVAHNQLTQGSR